MNIPPADLIKPPDHSKLGFVSTGLAITATIVWFFPFVISLIFKGGAPAGESEKVFSIVNFICVPVLNLIGLIFGVAGAFKKDSKKLFVIIGIIYNSVALLILVVLLLMLLLILYAASHTPWR